MAAQLQELQPFVKAALEKIGESSPTMTRRIIELNTRLGEWANGSSDKTKELLQDDEIEVLQCNVFHVDGTRVKRGMALGDVRALCGELLPKLPSRFASDLVEFKDKVIAGTFWK